jgi:hypothetical protein
LGQGLEAAIGAVTIEGFWAGAAWGGATGANVGDDTTWQENTGKGVSVAMSSVLWHHCAHQ